MSQEKKQKNPLDLTKAEEEIMQYLWEFGEAKVAQVIEAMPEPKPAYNTVSTIIRILEKKGFVDYKKKGRGHIYFPLVGKESYTETTMSKLVNNYFNGSVRSMLSFFVKKNDMTLKEFETILKEMDKEQKK